MPALHLIGASRTDWTPGVVLSASLTGRVETIKVAWGLSQVMM